MANFVRGALLIVLAIGLTGCKKPATMAAPTTQAAVVTQPYTPPPPQGGGNVFAPPNNGGVGGAGMDVRRTATKTDAANQAKNIASFYIQYATQNGPPKTVKELIDDFKQQAAKEYQSVTEGYFVIVPNQPLAGSSVLVYEQNGDSSGIHMVGMGDGSVQKLTTQQLRTALGLR